MALDKQAQSITIQRNGVSMDDKVRKVFRKNLSLLEKIGLLVTQDYPIESRITNLHFMHDHIPKTRLKSFAALLKRNNKFLSKALTKKSLPIEKLSKLRLQITDFHKYLTELHVDKYCQNRAVSWNYIGLAMHYLLDCYYHIYIQAVATKPLCSWCRIQLEDWDNLNNFILNDRLVKTFVYLNIAHEIWLQNEITSDVIDYYVNNMKFLVEKTIKDDIMETVGPCLTACNTTA